MNTDIQVLTLENNFLDFVNIEQNPMPTDLSNVSPFQHLHKLRKLNMRNNSLTQFLRDWSLINNELEELDVSFNNISLLQLGQLSYIWNQEITIDLSNNNIVTILSDSMTYNKSHFRPSSSNDRSTGQSKFILNNNPLKCDCLILSFVQFLHGSLTPIRESHLHLVTDQLKCSSPMRLVDRVIDQIHPSELLCPLDDPKTTKKYCPPKCSCWVRTSDKTSIFNCSNAGLTEVPTLPNIRLLGLEHSELNIENNDIATLPDAHMTGYENVNRLNVRNNSIQFVGAENLPRNLVSLDLTGNQLERLNDSVIEKLNLTRTLKNLYLEQNPWICDCESISFIQFIRLHPDKVDFKNITCNDGDFLRNKENICPEDRTIWILVSVLVALLGLFIGAVIALYYKYQQEVKVWLFAHNLCLWFVTEDELDKDKKYDAFISFSHKDEDFVTEQLVPELESGPHPFKICLHFRDWVVGEFIPNQVIHFIFYFLCLHFFEKFYTFFVNILRKF